MFVLLRLSLRATKALTELTNLAYVIKLPE